MSLISKFLTTVLLSPGFSADYNMLYSPCHNPCNPCHTLSCPPKLANNPVG